MEQKLLVMYDVDSTLWPLDGRVAQELGVERESLTDYNYFQNPKLTKRQRTRAFELVSDFNFFRNINFYPGVEQILQPRELGVDVRINTNSLTKEIRDIKIEQLLAAIPGLREEDIQANIKGRDDFSKPFPTDRPLIVAEDSPYSVAHSPAKMNVLLKLAWNTSPQMVAVMYGKPVVWRSTLVDINAYIYKYAKTFVYLQATREAQRP